MFDWIKTAPEVSDPAPRPLAILDWELATIGDPLLDLGYMACCCPVEGETLTPTHALSWYTAMPAWKLAVLYDCQHRQGRDAYCEGATQAPRFIAAAEHFLGSL